MDKETYIDGDKTILNTEYYLYLLEKENQNISLQQQLEEKDKVIDEILDDGWFVEDCPMILNDFTKDDEKTFNCENCEDDHKKCWLKYFENKVKVRGTKV